MVTLIKNVLLAGLKGLSKIVGTELKAAFAGVDTQESYNLGVKMSKQIAQGMRDGSAEIKSAVQEATSQNTGTPMIFGKSAESFFSSKPSLFLNNDELGNEFFNGLENIRRAGIKFSSDLNAQFTGLGNQIYDGSITYQQAIENVLSTLKNETDGVGTNLIGKFKTLGVQGSTLGGIMSGLSMTLTTVGLAMDKNSQAGKTLSGVFTGLGGAIQTISGIASLAAPGGLMSPQAWVQTASGIINVINGFSTAWENDQEKLERLTTQAEELSNKALQAKSDYKTLDTSIKKLDELQQKQYDSQEAANQYQEAVESFANQFPQFITGFDEAGNAIIDTTSAEMSLTNARKASAEAAYNAAKAEQERAKLDLRLNTSKVQTITQLMLNALDSTDIGGRPTLQFFDSRLVDYYDAINQLHQINDLSSKEGIEAYKTFEQAYNQLYTISEENKDAYKYAQMFLDTDVQFGEYGGTQGAGLIGPNNREIFNIVGTTQDKLQAYGSSIINTIAQWQQSINSATENLTYLSLDNGSTTLISLTNKELTKRFQASELENWEDYVERVAETDEAVEQYQQNIENWWSSLTSQEQELFNKISSDRSYSAQDIAEIFDISEDDEIYKTLADGYSENVKKYQENINNALNKKLDGLFYLDDTNKTLDDGTDKLIESIHNLGDDISYNLYDWILTQINLLSDLKTAYPTAAGGMAVQISGLINELSTLPADLKASAISIIRAGNFSTKAGIQEVIKNLETAGITSDAILDPLRIYAEMLGTNVPAAVLALTDQIKTTVDSLDDQLEKFSKGLSSTEAMDLINVLSTKDIEVSLQDFVIENGKFSLRNSQIIQNYVDSIISSEQEALGQLQDTYNSDNFQSALHQFDSNNPELFKQLQSSEVFGQTFVSTLNALGLVEENAEGQFKFVENIKDLLGDQTLYNYVMTALDAQISDAEQLIYYTYNSLGASTQLKAGNYKEYVNNKLKALGSLKEVTDQQIIDFLTDGIDLGIDFKSQTELKDTIYDKYNTLFTDIFEKGIDKIDIENYEGLLEGATPDLSQYVNNYQQFVHDYGAFVTDSTEQYNTWMLQAIEKDMATQSGGELESAVRSLQFGKDIAYGSLDTMQAIANVLSMHIEELGAQYSTELDAWQIDITKIDLSSIQEKTDIIQDSINNLFSEIASAISTALSGKITNEGRNTLQGQLRAIGLSDVADSLTFTQTAEGLKLSKDSAVELYQALQQVDALQATLVFDDLVNSLTEASSGMEDVIATTARIAELQKEVAKNEAEITDLRAQGADDSKVKAIEQENNELKKQLSLLQQIQRSQAMDPNSYKFMDNKLPDYLQGPLNYWDSIGDMMSALNTAGQTGRIGVQDFYNIVNQMNSLAAQSGTELQLMGETINGSAESAAALIQKAFNALDNVDGKGAMINLEKLGLQFSEGADSLGDGFTDSIHSIAQSQIDMLDAMIQLLETVVAMEALGDIDVDGNGIQFEEMFLENVIDGTYSSTGLAKKAASNVLELAKDDQDLSNALDSVKVGGKTMREMLGELASGAKLSEAEAKMSYEALNSLYEMVRNGDYKLDDLMNSITEIAAKSGFVGEIEVADNTFFLGYHTTVKRNENNKWEDSTGKEWDNPEQALKAERLIELTGVPTTFVDEAGEVYNYTTIGDLKFKTVLNTDGSKVEYDYNGQTYSSQYDAVNAAYNEYAKSTAQAGMIPVDFETYTAQRNIHFETKITSDMETPEGQRAAREVLAMTNQDIQDVIDTAQLGQVITLDNGFEIQVGENMTADAVKQQILEQMGLADLVSAISTAITEAFGGDNAGQIGKAISEGITSSLSTEDGIPMDTITLKPTELQLDVEGVVPTQSGKPAEGMEIDSYTATLLSIILNAVGGKIENIKLPESEDGYKIDDTISAIVKEVAYGGDESKGTTFTEGEFNLPEDRKELILQSLLQAFVSGVILNGNAEQGTSFLQGTISLPNDEEVTLSDFVTGILEHILYNTDSSTSFDPEAPITIGDKTITIAEAIATIQKILYGIGENSQTNKEEFAAGLDNEFDIATAMILLAALEYGLASGAEIDMSAILSSDGTLDLGERTASVTITGINIKKTVDAALDSEYLTKVIELPEIESKLGDSGEVSTSQLNALTQSYRNFQMASQDLATNPGDPEKINTLMEAITNLGAAIDDVSVTLAGATWSEDLSVSKEELQADLDAFRETVATQAQDVGAAIPEGTKLGIEGDTGVATSAAEALGQAIEDALRNQLQVNSPSLVAQEIGGGIPEGLAAGMRQSEDVAAAGQELAQTAIQSVADGIADRATELSIPTASASIESMSIDSVGESKYDGTLTLTQDIAEGRGNITNLTVGATNLTASGGLASLQSMNFATTSQSLSGITDMAGRIGNQKFSNFKGLSEQLSIILSQVQSIWDYIQKFANQTFNVTMNSSSGGSAPDVSASSSVPTLDTSSIVEAVSQVSASLSALASAIGEIPDKSQDAGATAEAMKRLPDKSAAVNKTADAMSKLKSKSVSFKGSVSGTVSGTIRGAITASFPGGTVKTASATTNVKTSSSSSGKASSKAKGNVNLSRSGNALVKGTSSGPAKAGGAKKTLMGELGPELVVSGGKYYVVGENGAEFVNLAPDAIVFNHLQTERLLKNGKSRRGTPVTNERNAVSFATGNISGPAMASAASVLAALKELRAMWQPMLGASAKDLGAQAGRGGGGGGGGGGGKDWQPKTTTGDIQRWYNLLRQIAKLEEQITYQDQLQNKLLSDRVINGRAYYNSLKKEYDLLGKEIADDEQLADIQKSWYDQKRAELAASDYGKIFTYDEEGLQQYQDGKDMGLDILENLNRRDIYGKAIDNAETAEKQLNYLKSIGFDTDKLKYNDDGTVIDLSGLKDEERDNALVQMMENFWTNVDGWRDDMDGIHDSYQEQLEKVLENQAKQNEILQKMVDNQLEVEQYVLKAIEEREQAAIDRLQKERDALQDATDKFLDGLNDQLAKEREMYQKNQDQQELTKLQRQLAILQRSGGSASQIRSLQQQIQSKQQDAYFDAQQEQIDAIQEASDKQIERLDDQIDLMTETLEYQKDNGLLWQEVYEVMRGTPDEIQQFIINNTPDFQSNSALQVTEDIRKIYSAIEQWVARREDAEKGNDLVAKATEETSNPTASWEKQLEQRNAKQMYADVWDDETVANAKSAYEKKYAETGDTNEAWAAARQVFEDARAKKNPGGNQQGSGQKADTSEQEQVGKYDATTQKKHNIYETPERGSKHAVLDKSLPKGSPVEVSGVYMDSKGKKAEQFLVTTESGKTGWIRANAITSLSDDQINALPKYNKKGVRQYKSGGLIDYTGPAWVDGTKEKPESILNAEQTAFLKEQMLDAPVSLEAVVSDLQDIFNNLANAGSYSTENNGEIIEIANATVQMNVQTIANDYDARRAGSMALDEMVKLARKSGRNSVSRG